MSVSRPSGNYDRFRAVLFSHVGLYGFICSVIGDRDSFSEVKFRSLRHSLVHEPVSKIRTGDGLKSGYILNEGRQCDLASRGFFFKYKDCF